MFSYIRQSATSSPIPAQIQQQIETQWQLMHGLAGNALAGAEQVLALSIDTGRATFEQSRDAAKSLLHTSNSQNFLAGNEEFISKFVKPGIEHWMNYQQKLAAIISQTQTQAVKLANQKFGETEHGVVKLLSQAEKQVGKAVDEATYAVSDVVSDVLAEVNQAGKKLLPSASKTTKPTKKAKTVQTAEASETTAKAKTKALPQPVKSGKNFPAQLPSAPQVSAGKKKTASSKPASKSVEKAKSTEKKPANATVVADSVTPETLVDVARDISAAGTDLPVSKEAFKPVPSVAAEPVASDLSPEASSMQE